MKTKDDLRARVRALEEENARLRAIAKGDCTLIDTARLMLDIAEPLAKVAAACLNAWDAATAAVAKEGA